MKPSDNMEDIIKKELNFVAGADLHDRMLDDVLNAQEKSKRTQTASTKPDRWRQIMKNPMTKFATAAVIIVAVVFSVHFWDKSASTAYALEHTIEASLGVRYLHIKDYTEGNEGAKEFWLEFDDSGQIKNIRAHMPEWESPSDGEKVTVWQGGQSNVWFKKKNSLIKMNDTRSSSELTKAMQLFDPKLAVYNFSVLEQQDLVQLEIDEPSEKSEPITVTSINSTEVKNMGYEVDRTVIFVDQTTKLVTKIEHHRLEQTDDYELIGWMEFYDYDQPIDPNMFSLDDEVPSDVKRIDWTTQEIGLAKGGLTDIEIAVKVVREFYEALIAKDYAKAGRLYSNTSADRMREIFAGFEVVRIISIGKPVPHPSEGVGGVQVPCKIEIEKDGVKSVYEPYGPGVREVYGQSERWTIHGGVK